MDTKLNSPEQLDARRQRRRLYSLSLAAQRLKKLSDASLTSGGGTRISSPRPEPLEIQSPYDYAVLHRKHTKLYPSKVFTPWYRRYVPYLPKNQQLDFQPCDEVQRQDEDIALQYFFGDEILQWEHPQDRANLERRRVALRRYNKIKEQDLGEKTNEKGPTPLTLVKKQSLRSILSANRSKRLNMKDVFGPTITEKHTVDPVVSFLTKLHLRKNRGLRQQVLSPDSKWRVLRKPLVKMKIKNSFQETLIFEIRSRFRRVINLVRCVQRFVNIISFMTCASRMILKEIQQFQSAQMKQRKARMKEAEGQGWVNKRLIFNPAPYRFSRQLTIPQSVQMALTKPWFSRSEDDITEVVDFLQVSRSFVEYPIVFQRRLARVAWLVKVDSDKAIIREKQLAHDFYFLLCGKASMTKLIGSPDIKQFGLFKVIREFRKDEVFGEESMSNPQSERSYSVVSNEQCVLLSINVHDYVSMLMKTRDDQEAPEHIVFLTSLKFLERFPLAKMIEEGDENISDFYFRPNTVIVRDIGAGKFVFVVKHGHCRVLVEIPPSSSAIKRYGKALVKKHAESAPPSLSIEMGLSSLLDNLESHNTTLAGSYLTPLQLQNRREKLFSDHWVMQKLAEQEAKLVPLMQQERKEIQRESEVFKRKCRLLSKTLPRGTEVHHQKFEKPERYDYSTKSSLALSQPSGRRFSRLDSDGEKRGSVHLGNATRTVSFTQPDTIRKSSLVTSKQQIVGTNMHIGDVVAKQLFRDEDSSSIITITDSPSQQSSMVGKDTETHAVWPTKKNKSTGKRRAVYSTWTQMKEMVKGDYIGPEWLDYNEGPFEPPKEIVALVSDGCEVILIKKSFLLKYLKKEW